MIWKQVSELYNIITSNCTGHIELDGLKTKIHTLLKQADFSNKTISDLVDAKKQSDGEIDKLREQLHAEQTAKDRAVHTQSDITRAAYQKALALDKRIIEQQSQIENYKRDVEKLQNDKKAMYADSVDQRRQAWTDVLTLEHRHDEELKKINGELKSALGE